jgi:uncharacterized protein
VVLAETFDQVLAIDGLYYLLLGVAVAGLVRGFSGFGTALIYMPFASSVLPPVWAIVTMLIFDIPGTTPILRGAIKDCHPADLRRLTIGALVALPLGLYLLVKVNPDVFRWSVAIIALVLLLFLITGWRYRGVLNRAMTYTVGAMGGFLAGVSGLPGPPVIMLYMSSPHAITAIRANILIYLFLVDILTLLYMAMAGYIAATPVVIGVALIIPYAVFNIIGAKLFRPDKEKLFRIIAYCLIGFSAVSNLPILR